METLKKAGSFFYILHQELTWSYKRMLVLAFAVLKRKRKA